jgi:hypothetical protein
MASASIPGIHGCGNLYHLSLSGVFRLSLRHAEGLQALFLFGCGFAGVAAPTMPRVWSSLFFPRLVQRDVPVKSHFLVRPQLLTRM